MYQLVDDRFVRLKPNERNRFTIVGMGVEIGIWEGHYLGMKVPWMRWWDDAETLLPTGHELAEFEANRAAREAGRADDESRRADIESQSAPTVESQSAPDVESERAARESERAARESERAGRLAAQLRALGIDPES